MQDKVGKYSIHRASGSAASRPAGLNVFEIGYDYRLGREVDDVEVEYVGVYKIVKP